MPHLYIELGGEKQLNEIVMAGSHDAGIDEGGKNAKTQDLDILEQARAGVRFFDIRVAAEALTTDHGLGKEAELKAFHGPAMLQGVLSPKKTGTKHVTDLVQSTQTTTTNLRVGTWGMGLTKILQDAKTFVTHGETSSEFLILKFDKSSNWDSIIRTCERVLGTDMYSGGGNLNSKKLDQLAGKVIIVMPSAGYNRAVQLNANTGILEWKNLYKPPTGYTPFFQGLQYWGSGGTSIFKPFKKVKQNVKNQSKILQAGTVGKMEDRTLGEKVRGVQKQIIRASPEVIGMMYWTTTGIKESIKNRNDRMWSATTRMGIDQMWLKAFGEYYESILPNSINTQSFGSGGTLKLFMPNIVMVDFADVEKGDYIFDLNYLASTKLVQVTQLLYEANF